MDELTHRLKTQAAAHGADLIGIAPLERFDELPPEKHPASIFPEARSAVVIGKRIVRGALRGVEEGTSFDIYDMYGRNWLNNRNLAMTTFKIGEFLEDNGWEAVPLASLPPETPPMGITVRPGQPAANVMLDIDDAAIRAGLAEMGYCGLLLTPEFGPRQRFQMILTDAPLSPDPLLEGSVCPRCKEHAAYCVLGAISTEHDTELSVCGKRMTVARIDYGKCNGCKNGASPSRLHPSGKPDRVASLCTRSCIAFLEETKATRGEFRTPFRNRAPWCIVSEHKTL